jgi:hypothetical protein
MPSIEFSNEDDFVRWVETNGGGSFRFARLVAADGLVLSTELTPLACPPHMGRFVPVSLPEAGDARHWWQDLQEQDVIDYWQYVDPATGSKLVVAAKPAVWQPKDTLHATLGQSNFEQILYEDAERVLGSEQMDAVNAESMMIGIATRWVRFRQVSALR